MLNFLLAQNSPEFIIAFVLALFSLYFFSIKCLFNKSCNKGKQPPSPPKLPILGNLHQLGTLAHRSLQSLGKRYGPIMLLHFGTKPVIVVQSAQLAMEIMRKHDTSFADKPSSIAARRLLYNNKALLIAPYGEYWRKLKSLSVVELLNNKRVESMNFIREEEINLLVNKIRMFSSSSLPMNLSEMLASLTNDIICRSVFGRKFGNEEHGTKFLNLIMQLPLIFGTVVIGDYVPSLAWLSRVDGFNSRLDNVAKEVDCFLDVIIQQHLNVSDVDSKVDENGSTSKSFLSTLLEIHKDNIIDKDSVKALILDMIIGGTDSTSSSIEWAMTELLRNPIVLLKLQHEVHEILGDKEKISETDLSKMHYLKAVILETLRHHGPAVILTRVAREEVEVMGFKISTGTMVLINAWAIARDPTLWDEPEKFEPSRFLNCSIDFMGLDFELIPFGAGRRRCPGIAFATANIELVLANLVQKFTWDLPNGKSREDLEMIEEQPGITIRKKHPLFVVSSCI